MSDAAPPPADPRLIVALDVPTRAAAEALVRRLGAGVGVYKIGLELLAGEGMALARDLKAEGKRIFGDWKLHDIGATVERATAALADSGVLDILTVHAEPQVLEAAVRGRGDGLGMKIVGVTVLTSLEASDLEAIGYQRPLAELVERRARQCREAGADGVVSSPREASLARSVLGPDALVITPGVRPAGSERNDQARAATPAEALAAGANRLVIGRPITAAPDPAEAAARILREMAEVGRIAA